MLLTNGVWTLQSDIRDEGREYLCPLFDFVFGLFREIFGDEIMYAEPCIVFNDPLAPFPMLILNTNPIKIRTTAGNLRDWSRFIYEFAHELTHYAIRQQKKDKGITLKWFEETICEAMSMYILNLVGKRWNESPLYNCWPTFAQAINKYNADIYERTSDSILRKCSSYAELQNIEDTCHNNRGGRSIDRNYLYDVFVSMASDIKTIIYHTQYIQLNGLQVDFDIWQVEDKNKEHFINKLSSIQPAISA